MVGWLILEEMTGQLVYLKYVLVDRYVNWFDGWSIDKYSPSV